jgi:hypothetical protein
MAQGKSAFKNPIPLSGPTHVHNPGVFTYNNLVLINQPVCPKSEGNCSITFHITSSNTTDPATINTVSKRMDWYDSAGGVPASHDVWDLPFDYVPPG